MVGGSHMNLMKAESPGPIVGAVSCSEGPDDGDCWLLYQIYFGNDDPRGCDSDFWEKCRFSTPSRSRSEQQEHGWFCNRNDSLASYTAFQKNVVTVFMILFGVNFNFYLLSF